MIFTLRARLASSPDSPLAHALAPPRVGLCSGAGGTWQNNWKFWGGITLAALVGIGGLGGCTPRSTLAPGCRPWRDADSSTEPPAHCFYFPGSLALDPLGDVLYATNVNVDRSFGGSTLLAVDVLRHERAVSCFRKYGADRTADVTGDEECGRISCADSGASLGALASIEDTQARESGGNPAHYDRCYCERDLLDPNVVNCESQRFVLSGQTTKLGFYSGELQLVAEDPPNWPAAGAEQAAGATDTLNRGLYLAVRGDPSVTFVKVRRPIRFGRQGSQSPEVTLDCGGRSADEPKDALRLCTEDYRVQHTLDEILIDPNKPESGVKWRFEVPPDPGSVRFDRGCRLPGDVHQRGTLYGKGSQNPPPGSAPCMVKDSSGNKVEIACPPCYHVDGDGLTVKGDSYQYLVSTHVPSANVAAYDLGEMAREPALPVLQDVSVTLFAPNPSSNRSEAAAVAPRRRGDLSQPWYVTSKLAAPSAQVASFRLAAAAGPKVVPGLAVPISSDFSTSNQAVHDIVFEASGDRAYLALYSPPALAVLDTSLRMGNTVPVNQLTSVINLCPGPSRLALARTPRMAMGKWTLSTRLYVTCYLSGQLAEVDPDTGELTATIQVGRGPQSIALNFAGDITQNTPTTLGHPGAIDPCADPYVSDAGAQKLGVICPPNAGLRPTVPGGERLGPRAYVSAYLDNAIAVVDLDPNSPSYRRLVSRIGLPLPKKVQ